MAPNYYTLKRMANNTILRSIDYLKKNPEKALSMALLTIEFQTQFGFSKQVLHNMLQAYITDKQLKIVDDELIPGENLR